MVQTKPWAEQTPSGGAPAGRLLLTGAAGTLGRQLMPFLVTLGRPLRVSDLPGPLAATPLPDGAEAWPCDLADGPAVNALLAGVDAVVHLGGVSVEKAFVPILRANIVGVQHLYDAARRQGTRRVVFASSNHVTGCYGVDERIGPDDPPRPDGHYGVSKLFGEGVAAMHWHRHGIESVCLRIGTAEPLPPDRRALACLVLDGVYRCGADGAPAFDEAGAPTDDELHALLQTVIARLMKMLTRRGVLVEDMGQTWLAEPDADGEEARTLRPLQAAAVTYRIAFGPRAGQKVLTLRG